MSLLVVLTLTACMRRLVDIVVVDVVVLESQVRRSMHTNADLTLIAVADSCSCCCGLCVLVQASGGEPVWRQLLQRHQHLNDPQAAHAAAALAE